MARRVRIAAGLTNMVLPNKRTYQGGDEVVLSQAEFDRLGPGTVGDEVIDLGYVAESGDAVVTQAPSVTLTSTVAAGATPTKAEFDALRADVSAILTALKGAGRPMTP